MSNSDNLNYPTEDCSDCSQTVVKLFTKFHSSAANGDTTKKRRKYSDETGKLWHGTRCPICAAKWRKDRATKIETAKQDAIKKELES